MVCGLAVGVQEGTTYCILYGSSCAVPEQQPTMKLGFAGRGSFSTRCAQRQCMRTVRYLTLQRFRREVLCLREATFGRNTQDTPPCKRWGSSAIFFMFGWMDCSTCRLHYYLYCRQYLTGTVVRARTTSFFQGSSSLGRVRATWVLYSYRTSRT